VLDQRLDSLVDGVEKAPNQASVEILFEAQVQRTMRTWSMGCARPGGETLTQTQLVAGRRLGLPKTRQICILGMISVLGRHLVGSEASVERIDLFLRLDLRLPG
jgi:hypothetical protein